MGDIDGILASKWILGEFVLLDVRADARTRVQRTDMSQLGRERGISVSCNGNTISEDCEEREGDIVCLLDVVVVQSADRNWHR